MTAGRSYGEIVSEPVATAPVTTVIPCYRCAVTVGKAVKSVTVQTLRPAELILVDDASGDETLGILDALATQYGRDWIRVIVLDINSGPGAARNAGWKLATQPFIAFLDADDVWHPKKIELQYRWMQDHPDVAMSGHGSALLSEIAMAAEPPTKITSSRINLGQMLVSNRFPTRSVMLQRNLPFQFHSTKDCAEDYLLWLQIILSGEQAWHFNNVLAYSLRQEFSPGGYSGNLWVHERRELNALRLIYRDGLVPALVYFLAVTWSLTKYLRRSLLVCWAHRFGGRAVVSRVSARCSRPPE